VKDLLRNHADFRDGFEKEVGTYQKFEKNFQNENGVVSYLNEATYGEMKDLIKDIGIAPDSIEFMNVADLVKKKESLKHHASDGQFKYLVNALFSPLDMTDYENTFVGWNEVSNLPISDNNAINDLMVEGHPENH
jgi:hypothetical protein